MDLPRAVVVTPRRIVPPLTWRTAAPMGPDHGPFLSEFATWLEAGHGRMARRAAHVRDAGDFLRWYDVNRHHDDVAFAARAFAEYGTHSQAASMRLLLQWLGGAR
jgi:hypothetical protein